MGADGGTVAAKLTHGNLLRGVTGAGGLLSEGRTAGPTFPLPLFRPGPRPGLAPVQPALRGEGPLTSTTLMDARCFASSGGRAVNPRLRVAAFYVGRERTRELNVHRPHCKAEQAGFSRTTYPPIT